MGKKHKYPVLPDVAYFSPRGLNWPSVAGEIWWLISHQNVAYFDEKFGLNWLIFVRYFVWYILVNLERGWRALQSQKGQKFLPAAGTYNILNLNYLRERLRVPFQSQKGQKILLPTAGTYIYYCELRERLTGPLKPNWTKKFCLRQALIMLWTM